MTVHEQQAAIEALLGEVETRVRIAERQGWTNRSVPVRLLRQIAAALRSSVSVGRQDEKGHAFVGGYAIDPTQPSICQICGKDQGAHERHGGRGDLEPAPSPERPPVGSGVRVCVNHNGFSGGTEECPTCTSERPHVGVTDACSADIMDGFAALTCATTPEDRSQAITRIIAAVRADERAKGSGVGSDGWLPIVTAPKNGSLVLLCDLNVDLGIPRRYVGRWHNYCVRGEDWSRWEDMEKHATEPTHWMPLPAPPSEAK